MQDNLQPAFLAPGQPSLRYAGFFLRSFRKCSFPNIQDIFSPRQSSLNLQTAYLSGLRYRRSGMPVYWYASILVCQARVIGPLLKLRPHCRNGTCPKYLPSQDFLISGLVLSLLKPQLVFAPTSSLIRLKPHENFDKTTKQC